MREERDRDTESNRDTGRQKDTCTHMHAFMRTHIHSMTPMWRSEEWVLILYHVGPRDETQIIKLGGKCFYPLNKITDHTRILFP